MREDIWDNMTLKEYTKDKIGRRETPNNRGNLFI